MDIKKDINRKVSVAPMMARDSDFQKAKHIMTIVQNNEKVIQANT